MSEMSSKVKANMRGDQGAQGVDLMALAGGDEGLRALLTDFYDRVFRDPMIGYLFMGQDKARLIEREVEWTARLFGAEVSYQGRPLREAHKRHPIRRGHFHRRNQIFAARIGNQILVHKVGSHRTHNLRRLHLGQHVHDVGEIEPVVPAHPVVAVILEVPAAMRVVRAVVVPRAILRRHDERKLCMYPTRLGQTSRNKG